MNAKLVMLLACLAFVGLGVSSVQAQASQDRETPCGMLALKDATSLDPEGNFIVLMATEHLLVFSGQPDGKPNNVLGRCRGQLPESYYRPSQAVILNYDNTGMSCSLPNGGMTPHWTEVISPSGQVILTCHLNQQAKQ